MAAHSSVLAWRIPGTGEAGGLLSMGSHRVRHDWSDLVTCIRLLKMLVTQSCPILCNPTDCSLSGFSVHGIFQARILEWLSILLSRTSSWPRDWTPVSRIAGKFFTISATREVGMCVCYRSAVTPVTEDSSSKCPINMRLHPHKAFKVCSTLYSKTKTVICLM